MAQATPFPLVWPENIDRMKQRSSSRFKTSTSAAITNVRDSLRLFGSDSGKPVSNVVISSNSTLGVSSPDDPGVAVWFTWDGHQVCFAVDRYNTVQENLQAIHHIVEARRVELRHGGINIVRATFRGLAALPSPTTKRRWTEVLGIPDGSPKSVIDSAYRELAKARHPDHGGSEALMSELNIARAEALKGL